MTVENARRDLLFALFHDVIRYLHVQSNEVMFKRRFAMQRFVLLTPVLLSFVIHNVLISSTVTAFSIPKSSRNVATKRRTAASDDDTTTTIKKQLTDRQLQFWEDVDEGLDDIESFWEKKNKNIDRIRLFALRYVLLQIKH